MGNSVGAKKVKYSWSQLQQQMLSAQSGWQAGDLMEYQAPIKNDTCEDGLAAGK